MDKKYQVFVSSTYLDLIEERKEVIQALLELDCIPAGMELFPAADEDQWSLIKRVINECDYYLLILGGRYGSEDKDGMGYTEKEYQYALEQGKPIISFLHEDPAKIISGNTEKSDEGQEKYQKFRELAQTRMCKFWNNAGELGGAVSRAVVNLKRDRPAIGWVRADQVPEKEASQEILELRRQVDELELKLETATTEAPRGTELLAQGEDVFEFEIGFSHKADTQYTKIDNARAETAMSWNQIFYHASPIMIDEVSDAMFKRTMDSMAENIALPVLKEDDAYSPNTTFSNFNIEKDDFQTIKVQFLALGLIRQSEKRRPIDNNKTYWTLTSYGQSIMQRVRAISKGS